MAELEHRVAAPAFLGRRRRGSVRHGRALPRPRRHRRGRARPRGPAATPGPRSSSPRRWTVTRSCSPRRPPRSRPSRVPSTRWSSRAGSPASSITGTPSSPSSPGQGGLEAQDWTFMLFKMYMRYCARRGWKVTVNDCPAGGGHRHRPRHVHRRGQGRLRDAARRGRRPPARPHLAHRRQEAPPDDLRRRRGDPRAPRRHRHRGRAGRHPRGRLPRRAVRAARASTPPTRPSA